MSVPTFYAALSKLMYRLMVWLNESKYEVMMSLVQPIVTQYTYIFASVLTLYIFVLSCYYIVLCFILFCLFFVDMRLRTLPS